MSASEKLKALLHKAETAERGWDNDIHGEPLLSALPELIAVLQAAEAWTEDSADLLGSIEAGEVPSNSELLYFALAALDEKLNGAEHPPGAERTQ